MGSAPATKIRTPSILMKREALLLPSLSPNSINPRFTSDLNPNFLSFSVDGATEDAALLQAEILSREEVLRRRSRRVKQLERCYRRQYWALAEEFRAKHREYCWTFGVRPLEEGGGPGLGKDASPAAAGREGSRENGVAWKGFGSRCGFAGCRSRAMPLTRFCHPHILSDGRQTLYKACTFVVKRKLERKTRLVHQMVTHQLHDRIDPTLAFARLLYHFGSKELSRCYHVCFITSKVWQILVR
ncbi:uncharacterized protein [Elaeis guineensis]|uniref:uncharacterized protein isoform X3 n=1 Tax=Elaeis guineensis var. tenera TaxID=51953 RepID=UPI003C6D073E